MILDALGGQAPVRVGLVRPRLTQTVYELLDLPGRDLVQVQVADALVHSGASCL